MATGLQGCTYTVDSRDVLRSVSSSWLLFARANDAHHLTRANVVGRSLWEFVAGERVRALYLKLLERARSRGDSLVVPFRCDSPGCRRDMQLLLQPGNHGEVVFTSTMIRSLPRDRLAMPSISLGRAAGSRPMCSFCLRILDVGRGWLELEAAAGRPGTAGSKLEHGVCPACEQLAKVYLVDRRGGRPATDHRAPRTSAG